MFASHYTPNEQHRVERLRVERRGLVSFKSVFGSVVAIAFQIAFHAKIHANDVFLFFKNYF